MKTNKTISLIIASMLLMPPGRIMSGETLLIRGKDVENDELNNVLDGLSQAGRVPIVLNIPEEVQQDLALQRNALSDLERGIEKYRFMLLNDAVSYLKKSISGLDNALPFLDDLSPLLKAHFYLSATYLIQNRERDAMKGFLRILNLNEEYQPEQEIFPPKIIKKFTEARDSFRMHKQFQVDICSQYPYLRIDSKRELKTPGRIHLGRGRHSISSKGDGYYSFMFIKEDTNLYAGRITDAEHQQLYSGEGRDIAQRITNSCGGADIIYLGKDEGELVVREYNFRQGTISDKAGPENNFTEIEGPEKRKAFYKRWWFWTGIGIAIAAGGLYAYSQSSSNTESGTVVVRW